MDKKCIIYRCKKVVKCENGICTIGCYVMLSICSADKGKIYVIYFNSIAKNRILDFTNNIKNVEHDEVVPL